MKVFGPIPSRRLGRSLGINIIPAKVCTYSCVYCQVGLTTEMPIERRAFYPPEEIIEDVRKKIQVCAEQNDQIDYLTLVADGEPTLDVNLGRLIEQLKPLGFKVAVISNSSLIWMPDVRRELLKADWVSLKIDAAMQDIWRRVDRPHGKLRLQTILDGMLEFSKEYSGSLVTETMLVNGINDDSANLTAIADFLARLRPTVAYVSVPTRPPAESRVKPADAEHINQAYQIFSEKVENVEYLIGYEGNMFASTGNIEEDLLSITAVHPMRREAVAELLKKSGSNWAAVEKMIAEGLLIALNYKNDTFYMRKLLSRT